MKRFLSLGETSRRLKLNSKTISKIERQALNKIDEALKSSGQMIRAEAFLVELGAVIRA